MSEFSERVVVGFVDSADHGITEDGCVGPCGNGIGAVASLRVDFVIQERGAGGQMATGRETEEGDGIGLDVEFIGAGADDFDGAERVELWLGELGLRVDPILEDERMKAEGVEFLCDGLSFVGGAEPVSTAGTDNDARTGFCAIEKKRG